MSYPEHYPEARAAFLAAGEEAGARLLRVRVPAENAPDLFIDFALLRRNPESALFHFSGVHGIEGFLGSAVQCALLQSLPRENASSPSLLFVHGVNPYGMQFHRRANAANVDLNRNFSRSPPQNPAYREFARFLSPGNPLEAFLSLPGLLLAAARTGTRKAAQAIASGQSEFPQGLFYTGRGIERELQLVSEFLRSHFGGARHVAALDLHTGLGSFGNEMIFPDSRGGAESSAFFTQALGREMCTTGEGGDAYNAQGQFSGLLRASLPEAQLRYALQEIGTLSPAAVLRALIRENYEWRRRPAGTLPSAKVRQAMLKAFFPDNAGWRERATALGARRWHEVHNAIIAGKWQ